MEMCAQLYFNSLDFSECHSKEVMYQRCHFSGNFLKSGNFRYI